MDAPSREELAAYIASMEERLKVTASEWMKADIRKGIELAKIELAKLDAGDSKVMTLDEAFSVVLDLAAENIIDADENEEELAAERSRQQEAIRLVFTAYQERIKE